MSKCCIVMMLSVAEIGVWWTKGVDLQWVTSGQYHLNFLPKVKRFSYNGIMQCGLHQPILLSLVGKCYWLHVSDKEGTVKEKISLFHLLAIKPETSPNNYGEVKMTLLLLATFPFILWSSTDPPHPQIYWIS